MTSRDFTLASSPASAGEETYNFKDSLTFMEMLLKDWEPTVKEEREALEQLLTQLDGLPLALDQISSLINAGGSSVEAFLQLYIEHAHEVHQDQVHEHKAYYSHSLGTVWSPSL